MEGAYDVLVRPMLENYPVVLASVACCCLIQAACAVLSPILFGDTYKRLSKAEKLDWAVRVVSLAHAVVSWGTIYGYVFPAPELAAGVDVATGAVVYDHYAFSEESQFFFSISCGYFIWDIVSSIYFSWGALFITHAFASFGVFYFSLYPFLHLWGRFYLGVFEISTLFLHTRGLLQLAKADSGLFYTVVEGLFALTFTVFRIVCGFYVTYFWWIEMVGLITSGTAHSTAVVCYYLFANSILMALQAYWFVLLAMAALGLGSPEEKPPAAADDDKKTA